MKLREITLETGTKLTLGKDEESNDELMNMFKGKPDIILHTKAPGSPFCVIEVKSPTKKEVKEAATICARYSQDWRDNKGDVIVSIFTGKDISKEGGLPKGTWHVRKSKLIKIKKEDILKLVG